MYELVLWHQGNEAVRITDKPVSVGQTLVIDDIKWLVEAQELPRDPQSNSTLHLFTPRGDLLQPKHHPAPGVLPTEVVGGWGSGDARTRKSATAQELWLRVNSLLASVRPSVDVAGTRYRIAVGGGLERQRDLMKRPLAPEGRLTG